MVGGMEFWSIGWMLVSADNFQKKDRTKSFICFCILFIISFFHGLSARIYKYTAQRSKPFWL